MGTNHKPKGFNKAREIATEFAGDKEKTAHLLTEAVEKAERHHAMLTSVWEELQALFRLTKAWLRGEYRAIPWQSMVFVIAAVVYFVNPFDLVPDFLPGSGYLDDATVIGFVLKSIKRDIEAFLVWEDEPAVGEEAA